MWQSDAKHVSVVKPGLFVLICQAFAFRTDVIVPCLQGRGTIVLDRVWSRKSGAILSLAEEQINPLAIGWSQLDVPAYRSDAAIRHFLRLFVPTCLKDMPHI